MPKYSRKYSRPSRSHGSSRKPSRGGLRLFGSKRKLLQKYVKAADKLDLTAEQKIRFLKARNKKEQKKLLHQFQEENDRAQADGAKDRRRKRSSKFKRNVGRLLAVGTLMLALGYQTHSKSKLAELLRDNVYVKDLLKHQLGREKEGHKGTRGKLGEERSAHGKTRTKISEKLREERGKKLGLSQKLKEEKTSNERNREKSRERDRVNDGVRRGYLEERDAARRSLTDTRKLLREERSAHDEEKGLRGETQRRLEKIANTMRKERDAKNALSSDLAESHRTISRSAKEATKLRNEKLGLHRDQRAQQKKMKEETRERKASTERHASDMEASNARHATDMKASNARHKKKMEESSKSHLQEITGHQTQQHAKEQTQSKIVTGLMKSLGDLQEAHDEEKGLRGETQRRLEKIANTMRKERDAKNALSSDLAESHRTISRSAKEATKLRNEKLGLHRDQRVQQKKLEEAERAHDADMEAHKADIVRVHNRHEKEKYYNTTDGQRKLKSIIEEKFKNTRKRDMRSDVPISGAINKADKATKATKRRDLAKKHNQKVSDYKTRRETAIKEETQRLEEKHANATRRLSAEKKRRIRDNKTRRTNAPEYREKVIQSVIKKRVKERLKGHVEGKLVPAMFERVHDDAQHKTDRDKKELRRQREVKEATAEYEAGKVKFDKRESAKTPSGAGAGAPTKPTKHGHAQFSGTHRFVPAVKNAPLVEENKGRKSSGEVLKQAAEKRRATHGAQMMWTTGQPPGRTPKKSRKNTHGNARNDKTVNLTT